MKLEEVKQRIYFLGGRIGLKKNSDLWPVFSENGHVSGEGASIYVEHSKCHYVIMERGKLVKKYVSENLEDILYPLFENITFTLASEYELNHRRSGEDSRRQLWEKQVELLERIHKSYAEACRAEIRKFLEISPYKE